MLLLAVVVAVSCVAPHKSAPFTTLSLDFLQTKIMTDPARAARIGSRGHARCLSFPIPPRHPLLPSSDPHFLSPSSLATASTVRRLPLPHLGPLSPSLLPIAILYAHPPPQSSCLFLSRLTSPTLSLFLPLLPPCPSLQHICANNRRTRELSLVGHMYTQAGVRI